MFPLPDLPYRYDALAPAMSERTLHFHHDKHHHAYVEKLNGLLAKAGQSPDSLETVIANAASEGDAGRSVFNNAAQAWNHGFFWNSMTPQIAAPEGQLAKAIDQSFGGLVKLSQVWVERGETHFGFGWVWLVADASGHLDVKSTHDAQDMVTERDQTPLLVCDLWEHAYYLDYQNDRKRFLQTWFDALPNWSFAAEQLAAVGRGGRGWRYPTATARSQAA
ncbi:MAG TPA: superoxide dismutase [Caulobacteraceae bacterium]